MPAIRQLVEAEAENLKSVRVKLTYSLCAVWIFAMFMILGSLLFNMGKVDAANMILLAEKCITIFYINSFVFLLMLLVYVLKRNKFKIKLGPIEFETDNAEQASKEAPKQ